MAAGPAPVGPAPFLSAGGVHECSDPIRSASGSNNPSESPLQAPFSCVPAVLTAVEATMSPARLRRYSRDTAGDKHHALRLYVWNARLCEEFYLPIQIAEVSIRNAINRPLTRGFSEAWFDNPSFTSQLIPKYQAEVQKVSSEQKFLRGRDFAPDHVVAALTFGFWVHLLTRRYEQILWQGGVFRSFPHMPKGRTREDAYEAIDQLRNFRNKVAHHYAIYDQRPAIEYKNLLQIVDMICPETSWLITQLANPAKVINSRPLL